MAHSDPKALARTLVLSTEDPAEFENLFASCMRQYKPTGAIEQHLVEEIAASQWRLRRCERIKASGLMSVKAPRTFQQYESHLRKTCKRAIAELGRIQKTKRQRDPLAALAEFARGIADDTALSDLRPPE